MNKHYYKSSFTIALQGIMSSSGPGPGLKGDLEGDSKGDFKQDFEGDLSIRSGPRQVL